jgi:hypothetical protein
MGFTWLDVNKTTIYHLPDGEKKVCGLELISMMEVEAKKKKVLASFQTANGRRKACNMLCGKGRWKHVSHLIAHG